MAVHYVKEFNADLGELSLNISNHWKRYNASSISSIKCKVENKKLLFFNKKIEKIEIHVVGEDDPIIIQKGKIDDDFAWVKTVLQRFSEKYKVNFIESN